ncbi:bifunctional riboflavin kinase/FAD synthetase [Sulfobacillus harzensis]|uniref:Riboflavin biosynthesis protein n=1 Tax=Sulfobacillus harzensis TaxID=2729629 RepID=A0A7Y0L260_9FIRM|nr:bifunctional riboflavin kinase/FAD synthetase [Sulfobacillus harzensis]NMP21835.1 bifunctional riboflavin kinase/FAD synthetase [Sulfobacillus harzensis]
MRIFRDGERPQEPYVVTIGNFDGMHRGHQALIREAEKLGADRGLPTLAITFDPHPSLVLKGPRSRFLLSPLDLKLYYLESMGVSATAVMPFTPAFASLPPEDFLDEILVGEFHAQAVVVGYNFTFGKGGRGTVAQLAAWGQARQIPVVVAPPFLDEAHQEPISSSRVRRLLGEGNMEAARELLGHPFSVSGVVVQGDQRGRTLGVPTFNVVPPVVQAMPPYGVYAGMVSIGGERLMAVASWGVRPTFEGGHPLLEVHALASVGFGHYGQQLRFDWLHRLRGEVQFAGADELVRQMHRDIEDARRWLQSARDLLDQNLL